MATQTQRVIKSNDSATKSWEIPNIDGPVSGRGRSKSAKPPTAAQLQKLQKDAWSQAFAEGKKEGIEKGYKDGLQNAQQEIKTKLQIIQDLIEHLAEPVAELDENVQGLIVQLSLQIAKHLVRREFKQEPGEIIAVVREALSSLPLSSRRPHIYLHPEDAELVKSALSIADNDNNWEIHDDLMMTRGDCRVETDASLIDASLDAKLSSIAANILGGERDSDTTV